MAKQDQQDDKHFTLDDQEITQVRYSVTLDKNTPEPAIASADVRLFKGRKEIAAFTGLTAEEVGQLLGSNNRTNIENGAGAGKRNQPKDGIAGKLEKEYLISGRADSTGLEEKRVKAQDKPLATAALDGLDQMTVGKAPEPGMTREQVAKLVERDLQAMDTIKDEAELKQAASTMTDNAVKSTVYREALENALAKHPAADTVTSTKPAQLQDTIDTRAGPLTYSRGRLYAELALDRAHERLEAVAEDRQRLNSIVARMENGLGRTAPQSEAQTAEWAKLDVEALAHIKEPERKQFATLVMAGVAEERPEYLAALKAAHPDVADQVEKAAKDQQLARAVTNFEHDIDTGRIAIDQPDAPAERPPQVAALLSARQVEKFFREIEDDTRPAPTAAGIDPAGATAERAAQDVDEPEVNSIEPDVELEQVHPKFDDEVRRNVALMWLHRAKVQLDKTPIEPAPAPQRAGADQGTENRPGTAAATPTVRPVPQEIEDAYLRVGNKFHYVDKPKLQAFEDKGDKLETKSNSERIAADLVKIAHARGWEKIKVNGSAEFRQKVWLEASLQGMAVKGYTPTEADKALLEKRQRESPSNAILRDDPVRQHPAPSTTLEKASQAQQTALQGQTTRQGQASSGAAAQTTATQDNAAPAPVAGAERAGKGKELAGTLLEHGRANFNFDKDEKPNYYVKYRDSQGAEQIVWGVGLEKAMKESRAEIGQHVEMKNLGKEDVVVKANVRDAQGKVIGEKEITTHRNKWEVKADAFRHQDPKEAVKEHPDLVNAYAVVRAAQLVAEQKFNSAEDRERFVGMARESLAKQIEQNREIPQVRVKDREQAAQQRREAVADEAER